MTTQNIALSLKYKGLVQESGNTANGNQQRPLKHFGQGTEAGGVEVNGQKVAGVATAYTAADLSGEGLMIKKGKKVFHKATIG